MFLITVLSSGFDTVILAHKNDTVNKIISFLETFVYLNRKVVSFLCVLDRISNLLKEQHKKQKDLTDYLGISKNIFTNWNSGASKSYLKYIDKIAEFFNVSTDYLLEKTDRRESLDNSIPEKNTIKIAGRDGSYLERQLTDDQLDLIKKMIDQMPPADDL